MTIRNALKQSNLPTREAKYLLMELFGYSPSEFFLRQDLELGELRENIFFEASKEREKGKPIAYILGYAYFYGRRFEVNENVLIPRPETELLIEEVKALKPKRVLDLCTGSGILAITTALETDAEVFASDISPEALEVARRNAEAHETNITFFEGDLFEPIEGTFDVIVSNPPYIDSEELKTLEVSKYEPKLALDAGKGGLDIYKRLIPEATKYLNPDGRLILEIGYDQKDSVCAMLKESYEEIEVKKDYAGFYRVVVSRVRDK
ncbi:peptide chain release factor N(5)-glutamine methyltransferase [Guggenheimella bovis]